MTTRIQNSRDILCLINNLRTMTLEHNKHPPGPVQWFGEGDDF